MDSSSSGSSKRARIPSNGTQVPSCLVDGCTFDLSKCRDYHRRHKVCELHSKTARVFIRGLEQRFCQQCSRFHSLTEFDEGKRSCRKRLDGHNRRRRKPQPDSMSRNPALLFSHHQGTKYLHFGSSHAPSTTASSAWVGTIKTESETALCTSHSSNFNPGKTPFSEPLSFSHKGEKQFPFLQGTSSLDPGDSIPQPDTSCTIATNSSSGQKMFSDGLIRVINSNRALSLLSSPPSADTPAEIGLSHLMQPVMNPQALPLLSSLHYDGIGRKSQTAGSMLVFDGGSSSDIHGQTTFQIGADGSSVTGSHHMLSFSWE
ncbi:hypothetical protein K2173_003291 [Erythroxylum novogranatense]|uniref:SBP-type domain-containing protein n=1 Tax=Erythroxylum novogranatense TaxID=1862640 RepID=A0AAV8SYH2_9ROSI|nr:hypothetical protein K2173_003291 [Erythroxylum novogranatense]